MYLAGAIRVIVAEDDVDALGLVSYSLRTAGFEVMGVSNGHEAIRQCERERPDVALIDIGLPGLDGLYVCRQIRFRTQVPIIVVTAFSDEPHLVQAFAAGADDYVVKPFNHRELELRIRAVVRRGATGAALPDQTPSLRVGQTVLDPEAHELRHGSVAIRLTPIECRLLHILMMNRNAVVPAGRLIEYAWGFDGGDHGLLKSHISRLRRKIHVLAGPSLSIGAIFGVGYSLSGR